MKKWTVGMLSFLLAFTLLLADVRPVRANATSDPHISNQIHISQINADAAWKTVTSNESILIAVLDTGADYNHPDLKENLVPGVNLVDPQKSAQDDNGHGTEVIGVLAAKGNNGIGVSGVLWNARVMPIKILDKNAAAANLDIVARGIHTALDRGAKVILMSVSSMTYSQALTDAVNRAEAQGAVLVAASGNEGDRVAYPAAYPTVIAVGGVRGNNQPIYESNIGPELNLMAPGLNVYTTKLGGKYGSFSGTSAAAPQVAGAAALILARHPKLTPLDVRQLLYQTATDLGTRGWDRETGYGLLNVHKAVTSPMSMDFLEPNNTLSSAKAFPIESQIRGNLGPNDTVDWYWMDVPYDGKVTLRASVSVGVASSIAATFYSENRDPITQYVGNGGTLTVPAKAGRMNIKLVRNAGVSQFTYVLTSSFQINPDRYEPNDTMGTARPLVGNQISVVGNFHGRNDEDWFSYYVREYGLLDVSVIPDNKRMDIVLSLGKQQGNQTTWDPVYDNGDREDPSERVKKEVSPGKYYILVREYEGNAVNGEYQLNVGFTPVKTDENEPNDTYRQATPLSGSGTMTGTLPTTGDYDWFQFTVSTESYVTIRAPFIPVKSGMQLALYNSDANYMLISTNRVAELSDQGKEIIGIRLQPGRYYIRLNSAVPFKYDTYRLTLHQQPLIAGFRDISGHWARSEIARLSQKGIVNGFQDATFQPDRAVTRAEFATMLIQSMRASGKRVGTYSGKASFADLPKRHWAYNNLGLAYELGIVRGYTNRMMKPDQPITRAEMAVMVARANNILTNSISTSRYRDVPTNHWAAPAIEALSARRWLNGYGTQFKPNGIATRAEVVVVLAKAYSL